MFPKKNPIEARVAQDLSMHFCGSILAWIRISDKDLTFQSCQPSTYKGRWLTLVRYLCIYIYAYISIWFIYIYISISYIYIYIYIYTYMAMYVHIHIHIYIYIYTHKSIQFYPKKGDLCKIVEMKRTLKQTASPENPSQIAEKKAHLYGIGGMLQAKWSCLTEYSATHHNSKNFAKKI